MQLTILGSGTAIPSPRHSPPGVLIRIGDIPILFDLGPGTIARLAAANVSYRELEYVFISHLHPDHTLDLATFLQANRSKWASPRTAPLHLAGCQGLEKFYKQLLLLYPGIAPQGYAFDLRELGAERVEFSGWTIQTTLTGHTKTSIAFRVQAEGKAIVFSGDAAENQALVDLARDADVLVCECSFPAGWKTSDHMTADGVGRLAQAAGVRRVALTHLYPPAQHVDVVAQVRAEFKGDVMLADDGLRLTV